MNFLDFSICTLPTEMTEYRKEYNEFVETFMANMWSFEVGAFCYAGLNRELQKILHKNYYDEDLTDEDFLFIDNTEEFDEGNPDDGYALIEYKNGDRWN